MAANMMREQIKCILSTSNLGRIWDRRIVYNQKCEAQDVVLARSDRNPTLVAPSLTSF